MTKNRFEQVDDIQPDAITLSLWRDGDESRGTITFPAALSRGRYDSDQTSDPSPIVDAFRAAIKLANEVRAPVVVMDPDQLWQTNWGELYRARE